MEEADLNFKRFAVGTTNIFPIANSTAGGQLLTEYNLRSRESIGTDSSVKYMIGPSYTHSEDDFYVRVQQSDDGVKISSSTLEILPGRALVNGHFVESLAPILIDLAAANATRDKSQPALKGKLSVGLKVMYSTSSTMAGSMLVENNEDMYEGIQVVILPTDNFFLPSSNKSTQEDESIVSAHLKLADFIYLNGQIINVVQNPDRSKYISADRVGDVDKLLSDVYVTKTGLNTNTHHYVFSSKSKDNETQDTWCDADDSLMVWDNAPQLNTLDVITKKYNKTVTESPVFATDIKKERVYLNIPHKQVDGAVDSAGNRLYYPDVRLDLPVADYASNSCGTVNSEYTNHIKQLRSELNNVYQTMNGKQVGYLDSLDDRSSLPPINEGSDSSGKKYWKNGDYVLVGNDSTVYTDTNSGSSVATSTMYVVLPGIVKSISIVEATATDQPKGVRIDYKQSTEAPNLQDADTYITYWNLENPAYPYRGTVNEDYFEYEYVKEDGSSTRYFYTVSVTDRRQYSDPIYVTGQVMLADLERVGGFYNVPDTALDAGYVYLDETGHLRLLDYTLLRSGTLAYQLGQSWDSGSGLSISAIQEELDDKVNDRVAFYTDTTSTNNVIDIYIRLSDSEDETDHIDIRNIDSRFDTFVYLHIIGQPASEVQINVINCEKIRIDNSIPNNIHFNIQNSCLYYDAEVMNNMYDSSSDKLPQLLTLWYRRYESSQPNLLVDGMTVKCVDEQSITNEISYWNKANPNDLHYRYALNNVTFANDGSIVGMGLLIQNDCTDNIELGSRIIVEKNFKLPQSSELQYPVNQLKHKLKIEGQFITAYPTKEKDDVGQGYILYDSNVTAMTNIYNSDEDTYYATGVLSIYVKSEFIPNVIGLDFGNNIDGWISTDYHLISGGIV